MMAPMGFPSRSIGTARAPSGYLGSRRGSLDALGIVLDVGDVDRRLGRGSPRTDACPRSAASGSVANASSASAIEPVSATR